MKNYVAGVSRVAGVACITMYSLEPKKVLIAMSGGVDSSVAAALLAEQGCDVTGLSMNLVTCHRKKDRNCCSASDRMDARAVCESLGISHSVLDCCSLFKETVINPFVEEYLSGRTPSPCVRCNEYIKFPMLDLEAKRLGANFIATGHYARVVSDGDIFRLFRANDKEKDQSYFLWCLTQKLLSRIIFPLGKMTKSEVRTIARVKGLPVQNKPESQEICFVPDDDYSGYLEGVACAKLPGPGDFIDTNGRRIGKHKGIHAYTVGQRRGLGLGGGFRKYVVSIDRTNNRVVLGSNADLMRRDMKVRNVNWIHPSCALKSEATVKIRSAHDGVRASIDVRNDGGVRVTFAEPVRAIAPGQAAVFYDGDEVLGGGWIE
ncbi:MAG: tRNA 2-thiouridine(34) synthase MnmA [Pseudomonadota bacterium]